MTGYTTEPETLFDLWTSRLSCDHWTHPIGTGGVPYGRGVPGHWITCLRCQAQRKVIETIPFDQLAPVPEGFLG